MSYDDGYMDPYEYSCYWVQIQDQNRDSGLKEEGQMDVEDKVNIAKNQMSFELGINKDLNKQS